MAQNGHFLRSPIFYERGNHFRALRIFCASRTVERHCAKNFHAKILTSSRVKNSAKSLIWVKFAHIHPNIRVHLNPHISISFQNFSMINTEMESSHQDKSIDIIFFVFFSKNKKKYFFHPKRTVPVHWIKSDSSV